jgi:hypothetical protein
LRCKSTLYIPGVLMVVIQLAVLLPPLTRSSPETCYPPKYPKPEPVLSFIPMDYIISLLPRTNVSRQQLTL